MEVVQQLERKQQKPPRSSIPGRAGEEQMPPKQMFKERRSANDQICVAFQVTRVSAPLLQTRPPPQLGSKVCRLGRVFLPRSLDPNLLSCQLVVSFSSAAAYRRQKVKSGGEKVKPGAEEEHKRAMAGLGTWHVSLSRMERLK